MIIKIFGTESLGVRGLSCSVELNSRKIFIDPGIALGWSRYGFLPHPFQIAIGVGIRKKIIEELEDASDVIFSHFDGDHCPLYNPNPYQLGIDEVKNSLSDCRIWAKGPNNSPPTQQERREKLGEIIKKDLQNAEGMKEGPLEFSLPVPHGPQDREDSMVMMSKIEEEGVTFVHASDIQLLDEKTVEKVLDWRPDIVLASGPPLYHYRSSSFQMERESAWKNAIELSKNVDTLIIDHHLLRSEEGIEWLEKLKHTAKKKVFCAADFMEREPIFLEAWRKELNEWLPVSKDWHEDYKQGNVDLDQYRIRGWESLITNQKIKPCKWYYACPIRQYTEKGKLERYWIENYCLVNNNNCIRYQMEEKGNYHPDNMLPDGTIGNVL
jgi:predicted metallo-beta-lactamase superfamily hydrolase